MLRVEDKKEILEEVVELLSRTIKDDRELVYHILFTGLSSYMKKPNHLIIYEKTSEGKTYPTLETAKHFPKENVVVLADATPQSLKYEKGEIVDESYNSIQANIDELNLEIECSEGAEKKHLKKERAVLLSKSKTLIDLRDKWIIFKEPPNNRLLMMLYSTLSNDEEFSEYKITDSSSGRGRTYTVVLRGTPAMLICTTKDYSKEERGSETLSRFNIVSPKSTTRKYRNSMSIIAKYNGLPKEIVEETVISSKEQSYLRSLIKELIKRVQNGNNDIFNPFQEELARLFPKDDGTRMRDFQRFITIVNLHCICYSEYRPQMTDNNGNRIPIVTMADIAFALYLIKDQKNGKVVSDKIKWYFDKFIPAWEKYSVPVSVENGTNILPCIIGKDLQKFLKEELGISRTTKQIREKYLDGLEEERFVKKRTDPRNHTREIYYPNNLASIESPLFDISEINKSSVSEFLKEYEQRFSFEINGRQISIGELMKYVMSKKNLS